MNCSACGHENPATNRFCGGCGAALERSCPACEHANPSDHRFCGGCGASLEAATPPQASERASASTPAPTRDSARDPRTYTPKHLADKILQSKSALEGERKQVTVLFADVKGSMELAEQLDPEEWHLILERFFEILTEGVHRFEGTVNQYTGDGIMALFGAPIAHEDHAQRACYAALHVRDEIARYATELKRQYGVGFQTRMGIHSGEVVVGKIGDDLRMDYTAQGHTVGLAQRMESLAEPNTCYLSAATERLVSGYFRLASLGEFRVKGHSDNISVYELQGSGTLRTRFDVSRARGLSRFVGRDADMQTLDAALEQARAGNGQVVGIVAEAGTGKTRLCYEFLERCRANDITVNVGRAVAHGKNIPFLPMLEAFRDYYGIAEGDSDRTVREKIAGRLLLTDENLRELLPVVFEFFGVPDSLRPVPSRMSPEAKQRQLFAVLRAQVQQGNAEGQFVTLIEDLHWMDAGSEAFLEQWVDAVAQSPSLLILNFRPEYHAAWMSKSHYRQIPLAPLGPEAVTQLLDDLLGADASIAGLARTIHARTGGNPFFTEEVAQSLIESGALAGTRGSYRLVTPIEQLEVPPTVQALLAARIDRLGELEKSVLQAAAVIGKEFSEPILKRVLPGQDLAVALRQLKDSEFIYEQSLYPVAEYAFKHPLTQEVALHSQLQERRKRTHALAADALEAAHADHLDESAALLAHHHEEAGSAATAARWHRRAAEWAGLNDIAAALRHWQRVRELARQGGDDPESIALTIAACARALAIGGWRVGASAEEWAELFDEGSAAAERAGDLHALAALNATHGAARAISQAVAPDYARYAGEAVRIADRTGDAALRCGTRAPLSFGHMYCGRLREAEQVADEVIELAGEDPDLGADVAGYSPLLGMGVNRARCIGLLRDPALALREMPLLRQRALDNGYPEQALWSVQFESEIRHALGIADGARALSQLGARLAEDSILTSQVGAALVLCEELASAGEWNAMLDVANENVRLIREQNVLRLHEPAYLTLMGTAHIELGNPAAGRTAAAAAVEHMRETSGALRTDAYAVLARAQLALGEPLADITKTLDEYAALLERTEFRIHEGELHELRARLFEREGLRAEEQGALQMARDSYARFGMTAQASRVAEALPDV